MEPKEASDGYHEDFPEVRNLILRKFRKSCSLNSFKRKLPITQWLPTYRKSFLIQDLVAGISVALTAIPQGIANAVVAGLPPQYGLYSCLFSGLVYAIFGSCKDLTIGPTAIMSLMINATVLKFNVDFAVLSTFLTGCAVFALGFMNLGFLVQFISTPTILAFISAGAVIIGSGQVKPFLGIKSGTSSDFVNAWMNVFKHLDEIKYTDTLLGVLSFAILFGMKNLNRFKKHPKLIKFAVNSRNAVVVILGIGIAYTFHINGSTPFNLTGDIKQGLPVFKPPPFSTVVDDKAFNFLDMARVLGILLLTIPLVCVLESISIAKAFSKGEVVDVTQELIALGMCNIVSSFASSILITGSLTRTAVNNASGVRTQLGGIFTSALIFAALSFLTGTFYFIPKTVLAAVIISAMILMVEVHEIIEVYRTKRIDILPFVATFVFSLMLGLDYGILVGIAINFLLSLYNMSRPKILFEIQDVNGEEILVVTPDQSLNYSSAEYFKCTLMKKLSMEEFISANCVVVNGACVASIDSTVAKIIASTVTDLALNDKHVFFWNWKREPVNVMMRLNQKLATRFKNAESLAELMSQIKVAEAVSEIKSDG